MHRWSSQKRSPHLYLTQPQTRARTMVARNGHHTYAKTGSVWYSATRPHALTYYILTSLLRSSYTVQPRRPRITRVSHDRNIDDSRVQTLCGAYPIVGYCGSFLNKLPSPKSLVAVPPLSPSAAVWRAYPIALSYLRVLWFISQ